MMVYCSTE
jgi:hypothetical protein